MSTKFLEVFQILTEKQWREIQFPSKDEKAYSVNVIFAKEQIFCTGGTLSKTIFLFYYILQCT